MRDGQELALPRPLAPQMTAAPSALIASPKRLPRFLRNRPFLVAPVSRRPARILIPPSFAVTRTAGLRAPEPTTRRRAEQERSEQEPSRLMGATRAVDCDRCSLRHSEDG